MMTIDAIKEAADAKAWEDLQEEDPHMKAAVDLLTKAVRALEQAEDFLIDAAAEVGDSPEAYRIEALVQAAEDLGVDVRTQQRRL